MFEKKDIHDFIKNDYFFVIKAEPDEIIVQSKNTEHYWHLTEFMGKIEISHKHTANEIVYHKETWDIKDLNQARIEIIKHDLFQLNNRKPIEKSLLNHIIKFYE